MTLPAAIPFLPERIQGLAAVASNLWWSWTFEARELFRAIDASLWHRTRHNPIELLQRVDPARLQACASDPAFLAQHDVVVAALDALAREGSWYAATYPDRAKRPIAYFCAEFALHNSIPVYSGGLGVLAGDHCKEASDLGVPLVGVGLFYVKGYFDQRIRLDGWQEDSDEVINPAATPLTPVLGPSGDPAIASVRTSDRDVHVGAWRVTVGRVPVLLLDTDLERTTRTTAPSPPSSTAGTPTSGCARSGCSASAASGCCARSASSPRRGTPTKATRPSCSSSVCASCTPPA